MEESALSLATMFAGIAHELAAAPDLDATLEQTVSLAVTVVPGVDFAGVSWLHRDRTIETPASSDAVVDACDQAQYDAGEGPCVEAAWDGDLIVIDDFTTETRWPKFVARSVELGMGSLLACRLAAPQNVIGALNLYSRTPKAFDDESRDFAQVYAAHASIALANRRLQSDLRHAYESRGVIGQAMGILVERHRVSPDDAFRMLVRASQTRHVKLRELAGYVVETGIEPTAVRSEHGRIVGAEA
ncbi:MAG: ANTAR domain-containing protein [Jatrophihabitans sp.]|uniref:ANTAR domain-containing protein n=1 Tax=Jatrophihabitans sp. TaxID=1932789 RepID=UPI003F7FD612